MRLVRDHRVLLFIALVLLAPILVSVLWRGSAWGFPARLLLSMGGGALVWLLVIFLSPAYHYPELLFILLVNVAPLPVAFLWSRSALGFLGRLLECVGIGFAVWLIVILLIVWPQFRH